MKSSGPRRTELMLVHRVLTFPRHCSYCQMVSQKDTEAPKPAQHFVSIPTHICGLSKVDCMFHAVSSFCSTLDQVDAAEEDSVMVISAPASRCLIQQLCMERTMQNFVRPVDPSPDGMLPSFCTTPRHPLRNLGWAHDRKGSSTGRQGRRARRTLPRSR